MKNEFYALTLITVLLASHRLYYEANAFPPENAISWETNSKKFAVDRKPYGDLLETSPTASSRILIPSIEL